MRRAPAGDCRVRLRSARANAAPIHSLALATSVLAFAVTALPGCGAKPARDESLGFEFESAPDSAALTRGRALLTEFEPYRASDGAMRVRGRFALPDGARLQISVRRASDDRELGRVQVPLVAGGFDTPPIPSVGGPLPEGDYRFLVSTEFNSVWQPERVLAATRNGLALTGPGIRRGRNGEALYRMTLEQHL